MLAAAVHLVLTDFQEVKHRGLVGELGIDGQGLYRHTYGALETLVGTSVIDGGKQRLLFTSIFCQQEGIGRHEEITPIDAVVLTELLYPIHTYIQCPRQRSLRFPLQFPIGEQRCVAVATIENLGVPLLVFLESRRVALLGFSQSQFLLRHVLRCQDAAAISGLHVVKHDV